MKRISLMNIDAVCNIIASSNPALYKLTPGYVHPTEDTKKILAHIVDVYTNRKIKNTALINRNAEPVGTVTNKDNIVKVNSNEVVPVYQGILAGLLIALTDQLTKVNVNSNRKDNDEFIKLLIEVKKYL